MKSDTTKKKVKVAKKDSPIQKKKIGEKKLVKKILKAPIKPKILKAKKLKKIDSRNQWLKSHGLLGYGEKIIDDLSDAPIPQKSHKNKKQKISPKQKKSKNLKTLKMLAQVPPVYKQAKPI